MMRGINAILAITGMLVATATMALPADKDVLIFATAPTQSKAATIKSYQPLVNYLSRVTGRRIVLEPAENFVDFSQKLLENHYDIVFDGPQFVGWRIQKFKHHVVAKLPGKLRFVVVVRNDIKVTDVKRLAGKRVCALASPNLLTLGFLDLYPNPARVPVITSSRNFNDAMRCAKQGEGVAAIMRDKFWLKKPDKAKVGLSLFLSAKEAWPHRAFTVGNDVDVKTRDAIRRALISPEGAKHGQAILKQFKSKQFVPATQEEYAGLGRLLKPIWGFHDQ